MSLIRRTRAAGWSLEPTQNDPIPTISGFEFLKDHRSTTKTGDPENRSLSFAAAAAGRKTNLLQIPTECGSTITVGGIATAEIPR
jgi:hypothetical protein